MRDPQTLVWWALGGFLFFLWSAPRPVHAASQSQTVQVLIIIPERHNAASNPTDQIRDPSHAAPVQPFVPPAHFVPTIVRDGSAPRLVYTYTEPN